MASGTRGQTKRAVEAVAAPAAFADGRKKKRVMDVVVALDDVRKKVDDKKKKDEEEKDKKEDEEEKEKYVYPTECWPGTDRLICFEPPYEPSSPLYYRSHYLFVVDPSIVPSIDLMN